jgi:hypothetical protein
MNRGALLVALLICAYFVALYWLADTAGPRCKTSRAKRSRRPT